MTATTFEKGLANIRDAIDAALRDRGVEGADVAMNAASNAAPRPVEFSVRVGDETTRHTFSREEIDDCGQAIDHDAAMHVRNLVSRFVRKPPT